MGPFCVVVVWVMVSLGRAQVSCNPGTPTTGQRLSTHALHGGAPISLPERKLSFSLPTTSSSSSRLHTTPAASTTSPGRRLPADVPPARDPPLPFLTRSLLAHLPPVTDPLAIPPCPAGDATALPHLCRRPKRDRRQSSSTPDPLPSLGPLDTVTLGNPEP
jgi:hypothetical protein